MTKEQILDYVMETPGNTNRNVLKSMLNSFSDGSGSGITIIEPEIDESKNLIYLGVSYNDLIEMGYAILKIPYGAGMFVFIPLGRMGSVEDDYIAAFGDWTFNSSDPNEPLSARLQQDPNPS